MRILLGWLLALVARLLVRTLRVRRLGTDPAALPRPCLYAFVHGRQVPLLRFPRPRTAVLASLSPDGRLQARAMRGFGFEVIDGSSSRGGAEALLFAHRRLKAGTSLALAVDGPRGPRGVVKPGLVLLAARTGAPIVPLASACARAWVFRRAWDGFALPKPFSRVAVAAGEPVAVPPDADEAGREAIRVRLELELGRLAGEAERGLG